MSVMDDLVSLRDALPDCETVAFSDLSQRMVLCVASRRSYRQEVLDALCRDASTALSQPPDGLLDGSMPDVALKATEGQSCLFVRSPKIDSEALCLVCLPGIDLGAAIEKARKTLEAIAD